VHHRDDELEIGLRGGVPQRSEQRSISRARSRPTELTARDHKLVAKNKDLKLLALACAQPQCEWLKHRAHRPVEERPNHASPP
jgi:hypothetical protein